MVINNIQSAYLHSYSNKYKQLAFEGRYPNKKFLGIRDIPGLQCGCCGSDLLQNENIKNILKNLAAGSKSSLENSALMKFHKSDAYAFLMKLSAVNPKKTIRELLTDVQAGSEMRNLPPRVQLDIMQMALISDEITARAPRVLKTLKKYSPFYRKDLKNNLELMEIYSLKFPKNTFAEIFNKPEIYNYHLNIAELRRKQAHNERIFVFKELRDLASKLPPEAVKKMQDANSKALVVLNSQLFRPSVKKIMISDIYNKLLDGYGDKEIKTKIRNLIDRFSYSDHNIDTFIVQCVKDKKTDKDIVEAFLRGLQATYEHVVAKSKEGSDDISNMIVLCQKCNSERANLPYTLFLKIHREMPFYLQKQLNKVMNYIIHNNLVDHDYYPIDIKNTVSIATDNTLNLNIKKYLKYREQLALQSLEKSKSVFAENSDRFNLATEKLNVIQAKLDEAMKIVKGLKKEMHIVKDEQVNAETLQKKAKEDIDFHSYKLEEIRQLLDESAVKKNKN